MSALRLESLIFENTGECIFKRPGFLKIDVIKILWKYCDGIIQYSTLQPELGWNLKGAACARV